MIRKCNDIQHELSAYIDNEHTDVSRKDIAEHLEKCVNCRKTYNMLKRSSELVSKTPLLRSEDQICIREKQKKNMFYPVFLSSAAALCVIAFLLFRSFYPSVPLATHEMVSNVKEYSLQRIDKKAVDAAPIMDQEKAELVQGFSGGSEALQKRKRHVAFKSAPAARSMSAKKYTEELSELSVSDINDSDTQEKDQHRLEILCKNMTQLKHTIKTKLSRIFTVREEKNTLFVSCDRNTFEHIIDIDTVITGNEKLIIFFESE